MPWLADLIPTAVSAVSSLFGNKKAEEGARSANAESSASTAAQMAFQERMSNTAWQRGVEDMRKAGINPLYGFTPASSPAGSSYTGQNTGAGWSNLGQQMSSAVGAWNESRNISNMIEDRSYSFPEKSRSRDFYKTRFGKWVKYLDETGKVVERFIPKKPRLNIGSFHSARGFRDYNPSYMEVRPLNF